VILAHIPGNILKGNWRVRVYVDDGANEKQKEALLNVWTGKLGGPVADLAKLVGEVSAVEQAPITFEVKGVNGSLRVGKAIEADLTPFQGATGKPTALYDTIFTTIPGSPAYVGKAAQYQGKAPQIDIDMQNHNAAA